MAEPIWERVTVVGCGLVGASFGLALKRARACVSVAGWDTDSAALEEAGRLGAIDEVDEAFASGGVSASDLVYLATPVGQIVEFLRACARRVGPGAVVTDAGSTKVEVCRAARAFAREGRRFVGGHPIAGSHLRGPSHARESLFEGAPYVLTPVEGTNDCEDVSDPASLAALAALEETLRRLGARVCVTTADQHDRALALVSHLPQLASGALAATVAALPDADALKGLSGAGFRDMTRLAASPWAVWRDILATNSSEVADALDAFINKLSAARDELRDGRLNLTSTLFDLSPTD
jgi:prephenate dehydrogenase